MRRGALLRQPVRAPSADGQREAPLPRDEVDEALLRLCRRGVREDLDGGEGGQVAQLGRKVNECVLRGLERRELLELANGARQLSELVVGKEQLLRGTVRGEKRKKGTKRKGVP